MFFLRSWIVSGSTVGLAAGAARTTFGFGGGAFFVSAPSVVQNARWLAALVSIETLPSSSPGISSDRIGF